MVSFALQDPASDSELVPFPVHRFTVEEYEAMTRSGILNEDHHVELLEGLIVPKMTKNPLHDCIVSILQQIFDKRLPSSHHSRIQCAISTDDSCPEPDVAIVRGKPGDYARRRPQASDIILVIEVSETSLNRDRKKRRIYAKAGIPCYWIVNLVDMCVETYTDPTVGRLEPEYVTTQKFFSSDSISISLGTDGIVTMFVTDVLADM